MRYPNVTSVYFATPLAFNAPDGGVQLWRYPYNFAPRSKDGKVQSGGENCQKFQPPE